MASRRLLSNFLSTSGSRIARPRIQPTASRRPAAFIPPYIRTGQLHASALQCQAAGSAQAVAAPDQYPTDHIQIQAPGRTPYFIDNQFKDSAAARGLTYMIRLPTISSLVFRKAQMKNSMRQSKAQKRRFHHGVLRAYYIGSRPCSNMWPLFGSTGIGWQRALLWNKAKRSQMPKEMFLEGCRSRKQHVGLRLS